MGAPKRAPIGQKWVSDAYPVHIFQLDHYLGFGTESGAVFDFQRGKKCPIGVKQTLSGAYLIFVKKKYPKKEKICSFFAFNLEKFTPDIFFYTGTARGARDKYEVCLKHEIVQMYFSTIDIWFTFVGNVL